MTTTVPLYAAVAWASLACAAGVVLGMLLEAWRARSQTRQ